MTAVFWPPVLPDEELITAVVEKPNRQGEFKVRFNRYIVMPGDIDSWTNDNEGAERISIKLVLSEETLELLEDQELEIDL